MRADRVTPLITIVTPSLNQASFLAEALRSVRTQEYAPIEHLVLDGGSTDNTEQLLRAQASLGEHGLRWRSHADGGQSAALNEGFQQAQGEIVGWLNADDRYRPDCFEYGGPHLCRASGHRHPLRRLHLHRRGWTPPRLRREIEFSHFILKYHRVLYIPTTATFFRRRVFEEGHLLLEDLHYAMDLEFFLRLARAGYRFHHLPRVLADFRVHPGAKSTRFVAQQPSGTSQDRAKQYAAGRVLSIGPHP